MTKILNTIGFLILFILSVQLTFSQELSISEPPNRSCDVTIEKNSFKLTYNQSNIFEIYFPDTISYFTKSIIDSSEGILSQVIVITPSKKSARLIGKITGSNESFPCEVERKREGIEVIRHSYGLSKSLLNRAIYDRKSDWVLSLDYPVNVVIDPFQTTKDKNLFNIEITGSEINIRFRPRYYQKHRGLEYFKPWEYKIWKDPVAGWCSWFAYFSDINEIKIKSAADIVSRELLPFGFQYIQIDDGYQQDPIGPPDHWLEPNSKFPGGLESLSQYILAKGLKPGIWTNVACHDKIFVEQYKNYYIPDDAGKPAFGRWIGYSINGLNPMAIENIITPVYSQFKSTGWNYFKVDALRHLRYEGYNSNPKYFKNSKYNIETAFRNITQNIRDQIGRESFMLGCWGIRPELIGIIDGCRIGGDGFGLASFAQFNSFNNIVWRNDPDHIELSEKEAYRSCTATSLTGSLFMLTDKPDKYLTDIVEPAKRSCPTLFTLPGQIYDVDPSRSINIRNVSTQLSGDGEREFDASLSSAYNLFSLEINTTFENWILLGRFEESYKNIYFRELGLSNDKEYLVFEYWTKEYIGSYLKYFSADTIDQKYNCQLFCIREKQNHPQVLATNRHISCGGYELSNIKWNNYTLSGESRIVGNDKYILYLTEPESFKYIDIKCDGAEIINSQRNGYLREIQFSSKDSRNIKWKIQYSN